MSQYSTLEAAKNILAYKLPTESNQQFCRSLLQNFTRNSNTVPLEIRSDFMLAFKELQRFADLPDGSALTIVSITIALSTVYPVTNGATIQTIALLARLAKATRYVDSY